MSDHPEGAPGRTAVESPTKVVREYAKNRQPPIRALRTVLAARYLGVSASLLRKFRMRGIDDPGDHGPDFIRISRQVIVYEISALDEWLGSRPSSKGRDT